MSRNWHALTTVAFTAALSWFPAAFADDGDEPLYLVREGRRVPTVVIPAQPDIRAALDAEPADTSRVPLDALDDDPGISARRAPVDDAGRDDVADTSYPRVIVRDPRARGWYAGYPVSFIRRYRPRYDQYGHSPYDAYGAQQGLEEAYFAGRYDERYYQQHRFNVRDMRKRRARVLSSHEKSLSVGVEKLRSGAYAEAIVALTMAAELNHADPACRVHLAQARLAQGHYEEGGKVLRRALELQPKLVYTQLHLESYEPNAQALDQHVMALSEYLKTHQANADAHFLLGFLEFQRGRFDDAYAAFRRVARVRPNDALAQSYLQITRPAGK